MISRRSVAAVAVLALATLSTLTAAGAAPAPRSAAADAGYPTTIRPPHGGSDDAALTNGSATVRKAKTVITVPVTLQRAYANETFHVAHNILYSTTPTWAVTRLGRHPRFGYFPVTHSAVLGFGAIPITADLHLRQVAEHGQIVPIVVTSKIQQAFPFKTYPTHVRGEVDVRLANVRVDRVALNVGANCHTAVPMKIDLVGFAPAYNLFTGGPLSGALTIPPFTGCGTNGDDLDPLLNGTISGAGNRLALHQGNLAPFDTSAPNDCGGCHPPKR
jgi:hypothetical protein